MRQGRKPTKSKEAKPPVARKSPPKDNDGRVRDLEKRLAEALRDKAEALEQQTATAEILRVISSSPTEVQPVLDAIVAAGRRLSGGLSCTLRLLEGEVFRLAAFTSTGHIGDEAMRSALLMPVGEPLVAQMMGTRALSLSPTPRSIRSPTRSVSVRAPGVLTVPWMLGASVISGTGLDHKRPARENLERRRSHATAN